MGENFRVGGGPLDSDNVSSTHAGQ
jgi:hypothetical protein